MPGGDLILNQNHALRLFYVMKKSQILIEIYCMETVLSSHSPHDIKFLFILSRLGRLLFTTPFRKFTTGCSGCDLDII